MNHAIFTAATPPVDHGLRDGRAGRAVTPMAASAASATPVTDEAAAGGLEVIVVSARPSTEDRSGRARQCDGSFRRGRSASKT